MLRILGTLAASEANIAVHNKVLVMHDCTVEQSLDWQCEDVIKAKTARLICAKICARHTARPTPLLPPTTRAILSTVGIALIVLRSCDSARLDCGIDVLHVQANITKVTLVRIELLRRVQIVNIVVSLS